MDGNDHSAVQSCRGDRHDPLSISLGMLDPMEEQSYYNMKALKAQGEIVVWFHH